MIDRELVARLVAGQFPEWAHLAVAPVLPGGWDNRTFRLGDDLAVRLPSAAHYVAAVEKEHRWLPHLAPHLPRPIPTPVALGEPGAGYPWPWSVRQWISGRPATVGSPAFARDLARFLRALWSVDATGGPVAGEHSFHRGGRLAVYDSEIRAALAVLDGGSRPGAAGGPDGEARPASEGRDSDVRATPAVLGDGSRPGTSDRSHGESRAPAAGRIDVDAAARIWDDALASAWTGAPVWFHGDVAVGNLLVDDTGRLSAVIDFGTCGVGDPACDLVIAWTLLDGPSRAVFREEVAVDDATWARARGWALWKSLITLAADDAWPPNIAAARRTLSALAP